METFRVELKDDGSLWVYHTYRSGAGRSFDTNIFAIRCQNGRHQSFGKPGQYDAVYLYVDASTTPATYYVGETADPTGRAKTHRYDTCRAMPIIYAFMATPESGALGERVRRWIEGRLQRIVQSTGAKCFFTPSRSVIEQPDQDALDDIFRLCKVLGLDFSTVEAHHVQAELPLINAQSNGRTASPRQEAVSLVGGSSCWSAWLLSKAISDKLEKPTIQGTIYQYLINYRNPKNGKIKKAKSGEAGWRRYLEKLGIEFDAEGCVRRETIINVNNPLPDVPCQFLPKKHRS